MSAFLPYIAPDIASRGCCLALHGAIKRAKHLPRAASSNTFPLRGAVLAHCHVILVSTWRSSIDSDRVRVAALSLRSGDAAETERERVRARERERQGQRALCR